MRLKLSNLPPITGGASKSAGKTFVVGYHSCKVTRILHSGKSVETSVTCIYMFKKVILEISRNFLLTGVTVLQSSGCDGNKDKLLTKFSKGALKIFWKCPGRTLKLSTFLVNCRFTNYSLQSRVFLKLCKILEIKFLSRHWQVLSRKAALIRFLENT